MNGLAKSTEVNVIIPKKKFYDNLDSSASLFKKGGTSELLSQVSGIDVFELICFLVVK